MMLPRNMEGVKVKMVSVLLLSIVHVTAADVNSSTSAPSADCRDIHSSADKCSFAKLVDSCAIDEGFINYVEVIFCSFSGVVPLGVILLVLWWLFLFLGLAVTADDFFCPSLTVMAKVLRMSDNIAGVTLLAFGNGAPDIFSAIAAVGNIKNGDAGLAFGALLGAGVFVTAVVAGAVIAVKPFQCMERPMLRDIIFYLAAVFYTFYILYNRSITLLQAIGFLLLYVAYVLVVVIGRWIRNRITKQDSTKRSVLTDESSTEHIHTHPDLDEVEHDPDMLTTYSKHLADDLEHHQYHRSADLNNGDISQAYSDSTNIDKTVNTDTDVPMVDVITPPSQLRMFLDVVNPIPPEDWKESKWYGRTYLVIKSPIQFLLLITIPVIDYDKELNNWNKPLSAIQVFLGPVFAIFATKQFGILLGTVFPVYGLIMMIAAVLTILVIVFSTTKKPPVWHEALSFLGFLIAVIWIYCIANEIVNLLQMFGVIFQISDAILGLTFLAWGNSVGDLIADTALARKGYPRIGISACFGGPLFNLLLGVGIPFTLLCAKTGGPVPLNFDLMKVVLIGGLAFSLLSTLVIAPLVMKFYMKRLYGVYLVILYIVFLVIALLTEVNIIPNVIA